MVTLKNLQSEICNFRLCVSNAGVFWLEEAWQQAVDAEEAVARERHTIGGRRQQLFAGQFGELRTIAVQHVHVIFVGEVGGPYGAELELQNELADEFLLIRGPE